MYKRQEWGHIIENGWVNEKGYEGNISIVEGKAPLNKHHVANEINQQTYKACLLYTSQV